MRQTPGPIGAPSRSSRARSRGARAHAGASLAPDQPAAERPAGPSQPPRRLVGRESLEVAEHDRQAERPRQAIDLAVQGLGLLALDRLLGLDGGTRLRPADGAFFLGLAASSEPCAGLARRPQRHTVEPGAEQVRIADRPSLLGQHEEDGLEGVLGMLVVAQELPADAQHHRPVAGHDRGEGGLIGRLRPAR